MQGTNSNLQDPRADKDDGDLSKLDAEIKDDKKEDTPSDEDKKLLDGTLIFNAYLFLSKLILQSCLRSQFSL